VIDFFRNLFDKKDKQDPLPPIQDITLPSVETSTVPLTKEQIEEISHEATQINPKQLIVGSGVDVGRQRENNEDALFTFTANLASTSSDTPFGLFMVADGMGGHKNGELASDNAVRAMSSYVLNKLYHPLFGVSPQPPEDSLQEIMQIGVMKANQAVMKNAPGGGCTLTAVLVMGIQLTIAHVGDSRAYAIHLDGRVQALTRDHSLVKRLEELGQITAEEASLHPQKSMLYRALGQGDQSQPDVLTTSLPNPGYLLICSDGLWGVITEEDIFNIITSSPNIHHACKNLVEAANKAGGPDNITSILIRMSD
jgi:serine/threonine protein phosphatase PrpC